MQASSSSPGAFGYPCLSHLLSSRVGVSAGTYRGHLYMIDPKTAWRGSATPHASGGKATVWAIVVVRGVAMARHWNLPPPEQARVRRLCLLREGDPRR